MNSPADYGPVGQLELLRLQQEEEERARARNAVVGTGGQVAAEGLFSRLGNRFAGERPLQALRDWKLPFLGSRGASRALALGGLGTVVAAGSELLNADRSAASNIGGATGVLGGSAAGAAIGALGAPLGLAPLTVPVGALLGGMFGGTAGRGIAETVTGENQDPLVKAADAQLAIEKRRMTELAPLQAQQGAMATQLEVDRANKMRQVQSALMSQQAANQMMLDGQRSSAALQQQLMASIFGGGLSV